MADFNAVNLPSNSISGMAKSWSAVVAVHHDDTVLKSTLLRSPALAMPGRLMIQRGFKTVAAAYNAGLREVRSDVVLFVHPDVYLPDSWEDSLANSLRYLDKTDPNWGVAGLYGTRRDGAGRGFLYSTGRYGFVGTPFHCPEEVRTVDEFTFAIRRDSGLICDEKLPSDQFQLGATDLCLQAEKGGMKNYVIPCFSIHNANRWTRLPSFWGCYLHIRSKWNDALPVDLPYATITRGCTSMFKSSLRNWMYAKRSHRVHTRVDDPVALYQRLKKGLGIGFGFI
jgi:hypothetical protein